MSEQETRDTARYIAAKAYYECRWDDGAFGVIGEQHAAPYYEVVDAMFAALDEAGIAIREERSECDRSLEYRAIERVSAIPGMPDGWWEDHSVLDGLVVTRKPRIVPREETNQRAAESIVATMQEGD